MTIFTPNVRIGEQPNIIKFNNEHRILGGYEAWPHSWPSVAYIVFNYRAEVQLPSQLNQKPTIISIVRTLVCAGTLIGRKTGKKNEDLKLYDLITL